MVLIGVALFPLLIYEEFEIVHGCIVNGCPGAAAGQPFGGFFDASVGTLLIVMVFVGAVVLIIVGSLVCLPYCWCHRRLWARCGGTQRAKAVSIRESELERPLREVAWTLKPGA